jgi:hypothetical protein
MLNIRRIVELSSTNRMRRDDMDVLSSPGCSPQGAPGCAIRQKRFNLAGVVAPGQVECSMLRGDPR